MQLYALVEYETVDAAEKAVSVIFNLLFLVHFVYDIGINKRDLHILVMVNWIRWLC